MLHCRHTNPRTAPGLVAMIQDAILLVLWNILVQFAMTNRTVRSLLFQPQVFLVADAIFLANPVGLALFRMSALHSAPRAFSALRFSDWY